ncbi:hypothetical protein NMY22_g6021 [Coprinellus aureogranulatus]|nr:hypothetical protein NMY22_g6021 [Coprinellus aureogranulatus]
MNISNSTVNHVGHSKSVIDYLEPHIAHGAAHSSAERCDAPKCHPDTRRAVQEEIVGWITYGDGDALPKRMMWLSGPAGAGKTAIAGSVAEICQERALLGATFFFSSFSASLDRRSKRGFVATLASHLAEHPSLHAYKTQLLEALHLYPTIFQKCLKEQAECLLLRPFTTIGCQDLLDRFVWPKVIIIDGLDEVKAVQHHDARRETVVMGREDDADQLEILNVLLTLAKHPTFPFCIFVASRPERAIENFFSSAAQGCTLRLFLDSKYEPDVDIERFLCSRFVDVRRRYGISESTWPGQPVIDLLIEMSSGQFIVPAVVLRYVESGPPQRQLDEIIKLGRAKTATNNPFAMLDAVYTHIFDRSPDPLLVANWIRCIASFRALGSLSEGNSLPSFFWKHFLEDTEGEYSYILTPLLSLLSLPPSDDRRSPITLYHKSLNDFLSSEVRCGRLYSDEKSSKSFAAGRCVLVLKYKGPVLPVLSSSDLRYFLQVFLRASPLFQWNMRPGALAPFLGNLCEDSKAELADCDVTWWTRFILTDDLAGAENPILKSDGPLDLDFPAGIYCGVHSQLCNSNLDWKVSGPYSPYCHPACTRWRRGIIDEARALGWCIHELERLQPFRLSDLAFSLFYAAFRRPCNWNGRSIPQCAICQRPGRPTTARVGPATDTNANTPVEGVVHRIPRHGLEECSTVFCDMFSIPQAQNKSAGAREGDTDENPITLVGCTNEEFKCLIDVLYPLLGETPQLSKEEWAGVLKLARLWDMPRVAKLAIDKIYSFSLKPVEKIKLGKEHGVPQWLKEGYTSLVQDLSQTSLSEMASLGSDTAFRIMWARDELLVARAQSPSTGKDGYWIDSKGLICTYCRVHGSNTVWNPSTSTCENCGRYPEDSYYGLQVAEKAALKATMPAQPNLESVTDKVLEVFKEEFEEAERRNA